MNGDQHEIICTFSISSNPICMNSRPEFIEDVLSNTFLNLSDRSLFCCHTLILVDLNINKLHMKTHGTSR